MLNTKSLEFYKKLVNSGAKESLAQSIVEVIEESAHLGLDGLATKENLRELRSELKGDINELRSELKGDINELRSELKGDIRNLDHKVELIRSELKNDINVMVTNMNANFRVIYIVGGLVSTILVSPILSNWFKPVIQWIIGQ